MEKMILDLTEKIQELASSLPPKQRKLAGYIVKNQKQCAFMTSTALGAAAGVSESTVIRFASYMGYKGYPDFQRELRESLKNEPYRDRVHARARQGAASAHARCM